MRHSHVVYAAITLGAVMSCRADRSRERDMSVAVQQGAPAQALDVVLERPMAHRREGQALLDSARAALATEDAVAASALLHRAASFFVMQANSPPSGGTHDLLAVARGLDSLANDVGRRRSVESSGLARMSAHANLAEAERHGALAAVAWSIGSKESVSDELTMAVDHVERAALDSRIQIPSATRRLLGELRAIVSDLSTERALAIHELDEPLASLHLEIRALHQRLDRSSP